MYLLSSLIIHSARNPLFKVKHFGSSRLELFQMVSMCPMHEVASKVDQLSKTHSFPWKELKVLQCYEAAQKVCKTKGTSIQFHSKFL